MKLLIISYTYAPDRAPRAYRWTTIAELWAAEGHQLHVVSAWKSGDRRSETQNGVHIHRVGYGPMAIFAGWLGRRPHGGSELGATPGPGRRRSLRGRLTQFAKVIYDLTWKQIYWPDYACMWSIRAFLKAWLLFRRVGFDAVITVGPPFSGHLPGLWLKRWHFRVPWLVDVGDPFSLFDDIPPNNLRFYRDLNRRLDRAVLEAADAVSVTVDSCRRAYCDAFPDIARKIVTIPPLLSLPPSSAENPLASGGNLRNLVYVGTLYRQIRNPDRLLALFGRLLERNPDLCLHFFGSANDCAGELSSHPLVMSGRVRVHGTVPRQVVATAMKLAHILVNIGNTTAHQLPSKLVEYAAAGRPILNLATRADDTAVAFLADYPSSLTLMMPDRNLREADIAAAFDFVVNPPPADRETLDRFIAQFRPAAIAQAYMRLCRSAASLPASPP